MQRTDQVCRYVGRYGNVDVASSSETLGGTVFDDTVLAPALHSALSAATVLIIDDPLSFPWNSIDGDLPQLLVIDASQCGEQDLIALRPVLRWLTSVDTILDPPPPLDSLCADFGCRSTAPETNEYEAFFDQKQLERQDRSIRDRVMSEVGPHAVLKRVTVEDIHKSGKGMEHLLAMLASQTAGELVGVWGVRAKPGARLHHGWVVFEPSLDNAS